MLLTHQPHPTPPTPTRSPFLRFPTPPTKGQSRKKRIKTFCSLCVYRFICQPLRRLPKRALGWGVVGGYEFQSKALNCTKVNEDFYIQNSKHARLNRKTIGLQCNTKHSSGPLHSRPRQCACVPIPWIGCCVFNSQDSPPPPPPL